MARRIQVVFDTDDPARLADFWQLALGYVIQPPPEGFASWDDWATAMEIPPENWNDARAIVDPDGTGPRIFFQKVPEGKVAKNRLHLDVTVSSAGAPDERRRAIEQEADRLQAAGATLVGPVEERGQFWIVLQDPGGNEFCVQ